MPDSLTTEQRRRAMQANRPTGGKTTEWALRARLIAAGISGWRMHPTDVLGKPDFAFVGERIAVFVDGCFWHGCSAHRSIPETNREFWEGKIDANAKRDRQVTARLKRDGWKVLRFWEHDLKQSPSLVLRGIKAQVRKRQ